MLLITAFLRDMLKWKRGLQKCSCQKDRNDSASFVTVTLLFSVRHVTLTITVTVVRIILLDTQIAVIVYQWYVWHIMITNQLPPTDFFFQQVCSIFFFFNIEKQKEIKILKWADEKKLMRILLLVIDIGA